ncbi:MAG TPA: DUF4190 domain-containing protein [Tepidisphaeraceae bacterium]|jgi:hypothetical protein|nr:DUF4190 domain-containing protein [Tepidisphaeraceae bacterium]
MSQYPPMQPPMMQPPQTPYGMPGMAPTPKISVAAICSLVCGILGCIPFITSIAAIILGFVGISVTSNPQRTTGRGLAIAGLILGFIGIAGWSVGGCLMYFGVAKMRSMAKEQANPFLQSVIAGDYTKAGNYSTMTHDEMVALHDQVQSWGAMSDLSVTGFNMQKNAGTPGKMTLTGHATFATAGQKDIEIDLDTQQGPFKVTGVEFK